MRVEREFRSEPEALAFVAGVEYVGDPAVRLAEVVPPAAGGGVWKVALDDDSVLPDAGDPADADEYSDDAPPED